MPENVQEETTTILITVIEVTTVTEIITTILETTTTISTRLKESAITVERQGTER